jgi:membrane protein YdbS with pleckstrin-like domain
MAVLPNKWPWGSRVAEPMRDQREFVGELPRELYRYLAITESTILGGQIHWAVMIPPVAAFLGGTIGVFWALTRDSTRDELQNVIAIGWVVLFLWLIWRWVEWNRDLIFITGYRIIKMHGIIVRKVAMMPIGKVTDMSYNRTPLGMILNYGTFIIESAGQDQALRTIKFVPDPDSTYRYLQNILFKKVPTDVNIVDVNTSKPVNVGWTGRIRKDPDGNGGRIDQGNEGPPTPW